MPHLRLLEEEHREVADFYQSGSDMFGDLLADYPNLQGYESVFVFFKDDADGDEVYGCEDYVPGDDPYVYRVDVQHRKPFGLPKEPPPIVDEPLLYDLPAERELLYHEVVVDPHQVDLFRIYVKRTIMGNNWYGELRAYHGGICTEVSRAGLAYGAAEAAGSAQFGILYAAIDKYKADHVPKKKKRKKKKAQA